MGSSSEMALDDFDDILIKLRSGRWNLVYLVAVSSCTFWLPCIIIAGTYVAPATDFICDPDPSFSNVTEINQCNFITSTNTSEDTEEHRCTKWIYNQSDSAETLTSKFDLVCSRAYLRPTYQTAYMIGNIVGAPINGVLSDKLGRKFIVAITSLLGICSVLISFLFNEVVWVIVARFITGLSFHSMLLTSFALFMEVCEPKYRSTAGILFSLPWAFGTMWWGFLGYMIREWRLLQSVSLFPAVIILICLCIYDESPRWLIINGRFEEALKCLRKAERWNGASLPSDTKVKDTMEQIKKSALVHTSSSEVQGRTCVHRCFYSIKKMFHLFIILFKTPELRRITLLMYLVFFVSGNVFYGLSLNAANFQLNPYMYVVVVGITEIPAYGLTGHIIAKFGRIPPTITTFILCGITITVLAFIPPEYKWPIYILAIIGVMGIAAAFQIVFLAATELFPTEVRLQGFGTSSFLSSVGGGTAPFITDSLGSFYPWAPSVVFGALSTAAGIASFFIPEMLNKHLPETIEQLEENAKSRRHREGVATD